MRRLLAYLFNGSADMYLSKRWRDTVMAQHEAWTIVQLDTAVITKDVAACRREAFWAAREKPASNVTPFQKRKRA